MQLDTATPTMEEPCAPLLLPGQWCVLQAGPSVEPCAAPPGEPCAAPPAAQCWAVALCTPLAMLPPVRVGATTADDRLNAKLARMAHAQLHLSALQRSAAFQTHGPCEQTLVEAAHAVQERVGGGLFLTPKVWRHASGLRVDLGKKRWCVHTALAVECYAHSHVLFDCHHRTRWAFPSWCAQPCAPRNPTPDWAACGRV